jgi:hypothetical protein
VEKLAHILSEKLGKYAIAELIGKGGVAKVYRALDTETQTWIALKVIGQR